MLESISFADTGKEEWMLLQLVFMSTCYKLESPEQNPHLKNHPDCFD